MPHFNKKNIQIFLYEDLNNNKNNFIQNIFNFLNIEDNCFNINKNNEKINQTKILNNQIIFNVKHFPKLYYYYHKLNLKRFIPKILKNFLKNKFTKNIILEINKNEKKELKKFYEKSNYE